jgi:hypothetical protein
MDTLQQPSHNPFSQSIPIHFSFIMANPGNVIGGYKATLCTSLFPQTILPVVSHSLHSQPEHLRGGQGARTGGCRQLRVEGRGPRDQPLQSHCGREEHRQCHWRPQGEPQVCCYLARCCLPDLNYSFTGTRTLLKSLRNTPRRLLRSLALDQLNASLDR